MQYEFDVIVLERRMYKGVIVEADTEEEAFTKAEGFDWEECLDEEEIETIEVESVNMW